jgi:drug/metabolite transporter (DMT)-like permease
VARETDEPTASTGLGTAAVVTAVFFWGMGNVLVKYIRLPGLALAFYRLVVGAFVYSIVLRVAGGRLTRQMILAAAPGGIAFGLDMALFFVSLKHTSVADASVITALQPALVFLVAGPLFAERLSRRMVGWTAVAVVGVVIAIVGSSAGAGRTLFGDLAAAVSLFAWSYYFVASKQARQKLSALEYQAAMTVVAAFVIAPLALAQPSDLSVPDLATVGWIMVMVLVPGGGHLLVNWAHRYSSIALASTLTLGIPVVGVIGAAVLLSEPLTAVQIFGIGVALVALTLVLRRPPPARAPSLAEAPELL